MTTGEHAALALRGLVKRFDDKVAVAGVDLDVPAGSFYGLLGPNGAGKTTTLSMAVGLLRPDAGRAWVLGHDVWADPVAAKRLLGVLPDGVRLFDRLTGAELLAYNGLLRGMDPRSSTAGPRAARRARARRRRPHAGRRLLRRHEEEDRRWPARCCTHPGCWCSTSRSRRSTRSSAALIRDILQRYVAGGGTVVFSSHVMEVVERLCIARRDPRRRADQAGRHARRGARRPRPRRRVRRGGRRPHRDRRGAGVAVATARRSGRSPPGTSCA